MACFSPLSAWQTGSGKIVFKISGDIYRTLSLPCGQCIGCRLEYSRQWAVRCMHENQLHAISSFITLTYDDDHCPADHSLSYRDFQLFMKRLRFAFGVDGSRIRFYMCGEYGETFGRPHFHAILFGAHFVDRIVHSERASGCTLYTSKLLDSLWGKGFCSIGDVTFESAAYVSRYIVKKVTGDAAAEHYKLVDDNGEVFWRVPEFTRMSLKPGIGSDWYKKYKREVDVRDAVVMRGVEMKPPRYYDKMFQAVDPENFEYVKIAREAAAARNSADCTPDRLKVREVCAKARLAFKPRSIE